MLVSIKADVYCDHTMDGAPVYRIYVDNDLLTERSWIWPAYEIFIRENIEVDVEPGEHQLRIEKCSGTGNFTVKQMTVNDQVVNDLTFTV